MSPSGPSALGRSPLPARPRRPMLIFANISVLLCPLPLLIALVSSTVAVSPLRTLVNFVSGSYLEVEPSLKIIYQHNFLMSTVSLLVAHPSNPSSLILSTPTRRKYTRSKREPMACSNCRKSCVGKSRNLLYLAGNCIVPDQVPCANPQTMGNRWTQWLVVHYPMQPLSHLRVNRCARINIVRVL